MTAKMIFMKLKPKMPKSVRDRKRKDDRVDAQKIFELLKGHVLAGNELPDIWITDHQTRYDREIVRSRLDAGEKLTAVKTQVQTLLKRNHVKRPESVRRPARIAGTERYSAALAGCASPPPVAGGAVVLGAAGLSTGAGESVTTEAPVR